jgi:hypothetical protein
VCWEKSGNPDKLYITGYESIQKNIFYHLFFTRPQ